MSDCSVPYRLPRYPADDDIVCDKFGNRWRYSAEVDTWLLQGVDFEIPLVSATNDGIISPEIHNKLTLVDTILQNFPYTLKINPATDAYWYLFRSGNKLVKFTRENAADLRVELDTGRLYQLFSKIACQGRRGLTGDKGLTGVRGKPTIPENWYKAKADGTALQVSVKVALPIDTPISIRLFKLNVVATPVETEQLDCVVPTTQIVTLPAGNYRPYIDIDYVVGGTISVMTDVLGVVGLENAVNLTYDAESTVLCGTITGSEPWGERWYMKVRQRGPVGDDGRDAPDFLEVTDVEVDDPDLKVTLPLTSLRLSNDKRTIYTIRQTCDKICVGKLRFAINAGSLLPTSLLAINSDNVTGKFVALQRTTDECKDIVTFEHAFRFAEAPALELPSWTPLPGCITNRHFSSLNFDWVGNTSVPANWDTLDGPVNSAYPWDILLQNQPEVDECCQEDLFYVSGNDCANADDGSGSGTNTLPEGLLLFTNGSHTSSAPKYSYIPVIPATEPSIPLGTNSNGWCFGAYRHGSTIYMPADIELAELIIFNRALSQDEVSTINTWAADPTGALSLPSGAVFWLSGNYGLKQDLAGATDAVNAGDVVARWNDRCPLSNLYARYYSTGGIGTSPVIATDLINGSRAVKFDQSGAVMTGSVTVAGQEAASGYKMLELPDSLMSLDYRSNITMFILYKQATAVPTGDYQRIVSKIGSGPLASVGHNNPGTLDAEDTTQLFYLAFDAAHPYRDDTATPSTQMLSSLRRGSYSYTIGGVTTFDTTYRGIIDAVRYDPNHDGNPQIPLAGYTYRITCMQNNLPQFVSY